MGDRGEKRDDIQRKIRILFMNWVDIHNFNAQSLNTRDIALRLDPKRFESTMFFANIPDPRVRSKKSIHLIQLPPRFGSLVVEAHMVWGNCDIIFYPPHDRLMSWYRTLSWAGKKKKIVATIEGTAQQFQAAPSPLKEKILRVCMEADACYALSPYIAKTMKEEYNLKTDVVPIGVDTSLFTPVERPAYRRPVKVLYVGSIQPRKQVDILLCLAREIGPEKAEFHIIGDIIGHSDYRDALLRRKVEEKLNHVHFRGALSQSEVASWMGKCDIFVLPSRLEGTPKVLYEASATGLPCIVFEDYHTPSVVNGITGFQVKELDEMQTCLQWLIGDDGVRRRMGQAAAEHARQFDWDLVIKQWERVFERVAGRKP